MRALFITHQLSRTGAPLVLLDTIKICLDEGIDVGVVALYDGELRSEFEELGLPIRLQESFATDQALEFLTYAKEFDLVVANTIVCNQAIQMLNLIDVPVLWWIHESDSYFDAYRESLLPFKELKAHIHVLAVSPKIQRIGRERYHENWTYFPFGVRDAEVAHEGEASSAVTFLVVGQLSRQKGIDIVCEAYRILPEELRTQCRFLLYGSRVNYEPSILAQVQLLESESFRFFGEMAHEEMLSEMSRADFLLSASREDSMPTTAAESMMESRPVILSDGCGISQLMTDGKQGLVFRKEDPQALCKVIERAVQIRKAGERLFPGESFSYEGMCREARAMYEAQFSMDIFRERFLELANRMTANPRPGLIFCTGGIDMQDIYSHELMKEFERMGFAVLKMENQELQRSLMALSTFMEKNPVLAVITFNNLMMRLEITKGKRLWDQLRVPVINILTDHPFCYPEEMKAAGAGDIVICIDRNHMSYLQRFYPNIQTCGFLAHGGKNLREVPKRIADRSIPVMYAGRLPRVNINKILPDFSKYPFDAEGVCQEALECLLADPSVLPEDAIEQTLLRRGERVDDERLAELISEFRYVDLLAVSHFREKTICALAEAGIPVTIFGTGWETCDWIHLPNVDYRGQVSADEIMRAMQDAKIVLNTMTSGRDGAHDRIFNGMLSGAVVATDSSVYLREVFSEEEALIFELTELDQLPDRIKALLADEEKMQRMADLGCEKTLRHHTWEERAHELYEGLLKN